jgi:hypothetical protein
MSTITAALGQLLHDRATRGETLSREEQEQLRLWYAEQDQEETVRLASASIPNDLASLQAQVQHVTARVVVQAQRIHLLASENAQLRQEIATLQRLLAEKLTGQPA